MGMNMISFKNGPIEVIDQSTKTLFDERYAGLGALIGPHFHRRKKEILPAIGDESLFPHIARVKAKGTADPFSHGIGRYAPWKYEATPTSIKGILTGKDTWNGVPLANLEGQQFTMRYEAVLSPSGLNIALSVVSDTDSLVGIHYYYHLPEGKGKVISAVQPHYIDQNESKPIPSAWSIDNQNILTFDLDQEADFTFHPYPHPRQGKIALETTSYRLDTTYTCASQENAWQLYHPKGASYVCIEPVSAQDPRHPNLTVSSLNIHLTITPR
jgi:galactose mutarotase-like enzyme